MKKIALFAAAMMICAGMAFAQEPVKKSNDKNAKTECQQTTKQDKAATPTAAPNQHCGNCPHHAKANAAANAKPECKKAENSNCKSDCKKNEKASCKKEDCTKAPAKK